VLHQSPFCSDEAVTVRPTSEQVAKSMGQFYSQNVEVVPGKLLPDRLLPIKLGTRFISGAEARNCRL
jgi:hypothetical protein